VERFGRDRIIAFPNVTSVQTLFARLAEPWDDVKVISLHGREGSSYRKAGWLREVINHPKVAFLTDPQHPPVWIAERMLEAGIRRRTFVVAENLGLPTENIHRMPMEEVNGREFSSLNLVAVLPASDEEAEKRLAQPAPVMGIDEDSFRHEAGLITKMEVRAVVLAHLQLIPDLVLWDLGAGSGSVSIEASRVVPLKQAIAVEKNEARYLDLLENLRRFCCPDVLAIHGNSLEAIRSLPDPDRVFIGGSGRNLAEMLEAVATRLKPFGVAVMTAVTLETMGMALAFWPGKPFDVSMAQVQINRAVHVREALRLEALNPVFVISARRQA
jgi:precorrin-6Y C5,15-methyltransferase (decarboxylating)